MEKEFGFSQEVAVLTISLFVAGYCVGPLLWGPLSESYGRRPLFIGTFLVYTGFQVGCALSKNTASILVFRFLGGTFAAAPLTNSGALIADIWDGDHRGQAMSLFSLAPFAGPSIGPIVAGFIQVSGTVSDVGLSLTPSSPHSSTPLLPHSQHAVPSEPCAAVLTCPELEMGILDLDHIW
jgi:multidrug resistance protein